MIGIAFPATAGPPVGMNMNDDRLFTDAMKFSESGGWYDFTPPPGNPHFGVDANGWPTSDCVNNFWDLRVNQSWQSPDPNAVAQDMSGVYKMSFNGIAQLQSQSGGLFTVSSQVYTPATNTTTLDLTIPAGEETLFLRFVNTQRTQGSAVNTGITNIKLIQPGYPTTNGLPNSSTPVFSDPYTGLNLGGKGSIHLLQDFTTLRWMGIADTNRSLKAYYAGGDAYVPKYPGQTGWSLRRLPSYAFQEQSGNLSGMSWEYIVQFSNQMNKDVWINIPVAASDDYITKLAQLLKYGSDGVNPYTSTQASPVWAPLNANLHIYVEYANEVWNTSLASSYPYVLDMSNDPNMPAPVRGWNGNAYAYRSMQISNLFKGVWGAGAMNTTIRPLLAWQSVAMGGLNAEFQMIATNYGAPSSFFYGGSSAPYFGTTASDADATAVFADLNANIAGPVYDQALQLTSVSKYWGLKSLGYEGGPGLITNDNTTALLYDNVDRDARMTSTCLSYYNTLYGSGGLDFFNQLGLESIEIAKYGMWGTYEEVTKNTVRSASFDQFVAAPAPPVTAGVALPTTTGSPVTIAAGAYMLNQYGVFGPGSGSTGLGTSGQYLMYLLRNTTGATTTYTVSFNSGECCPNSSKMYQILVDSVALGAPFQIPANGVNTAAFTFTAGAGLHSVEVAGTSTSGSTMNYLTVNYVSGGSSTLVQNPGFETGSFSSWAPYGTYSVTNAAPHTGTYSAVLTAAGSGYNQTISGLTPNTTYVLTAWLKNAVNGDQMYIGVNNFGSAQIASGTTGTAYTEVALTFTTGATNTSATIFGYKQTGSGASYADDFVLAQATNLALNPGFETGTFSSWAPYGGNSITTGNAHGGTYAATLTAAGSGYDQIITGLTPNTTYVLTAWMKTAVSGDQMYLGVKNYGSAQIAVGPAGTAYGEMSLTFTTGATNTSADIFGYKQTGTGASHADDFVLTR